MMLNSFMTVSNSWNLEDDQQDTICIWDYPSSGTSAKYRCYGTYNCPHTNSGNGNMNPTLAEFKAIMADASTDWWNEFHGSRDGTHSW